MKKALFIAVFSVIFMPSLASAAWWNPFSWGKTETYTRQQASVQTVAETENPTPTAVSTTTTIIQEKIVEKPVEKVVTKTITVSDPLLQKQIDSLIAENNGLKKKLENADSLYQGCKVSVSMYQADLIDTKALYPQVQKILADREAVSTLKSKITWLESVREKMRGRNTARIEDIQELVTGTNSYYPQGFLTKQEYEDLAAGKYNELNKDWRYYIYMKAGTEQGKIKLELVKQQ